MIRPIFKSNTIRKGPTLFGQNKKESDDMGEEYEKQAWYLQKEKWMWVLGLIILVLGAFGIQVPTEFLEGLPFHIPQVSHGAFGTIVLYSVAKIIKGLFYKYIKK